MAWRYLQSNTADLLEQLSFQLEFLRSFCRSINVRACLGTTTSTTTCINNNHKTCNSGKEEGDKHKNNHKINNNKSNSCSEIPPLTTGNNLLFLLLARRNVPSAMSFVSTILCCFLSLLVWTVTVVGLHQLRSSSSSNSPEAVTDLWRPSLSSSSSLPSSAFRFDWSTEDNYQASAEELRNQPQAQDSQDPQQDAHTTAAFCHSRFADIRRDNIDYNFHKVYSCERQRFQDGLIESLLSLGTSSTTSSTETKEDEECLAQDSSTSINNNSNNNKRNWIVFTAGVMGAGKSYTMKHLHERGRFPLDAFVTVDPDRVRRHLPEFERYVQRIPERAGELTRKESGMIAEILTEAALRRGRNVLVDGTLRNSSWYQTYFDELRRRYPRLLIGILHVTAPREAVLQRAMNRAKVTGRVVPRDLLERTMLEVPKSIQVLSQKVDFAVELRNPPDSTDVEIATEGITWNSFQQVWKKPSCVPTGRIANDYVHIRERPPLAVGA